MLRFRAFLAPQTGRELRGSAVRIENGYQPFAIDGTCTYWLGGGWNAPDDLVSRDQGWRTGKVDAAFEAALDAAIPFDDFAALSDCGPLPGGAADVTPRVLWSERATAGCWTTGPLFDAVWGAIETRGADLWNRGVPLDGPLHVSFVETGAQMSVPSVPWPIPTPLTSFSLDASNRDDFAIGVSHLVSDTALTAPLRALRETFITNATAHKYFPGDGLVVSDGPIVGDVFMRDAAPYEDAHGLLPGSDTP